MDGLPEWGETAISSVHAFSVPTLIESVSSGFVAVIFPDTNLLLTNNDSEICSA